MRWTRMGWAVLLALCLTGAAQGYNMGLEGTYLAANPTLDSRPNPAPEAGQPPWVGDTHLGFSGSVAPDWYVYYPNWIGGSHWNLGPENTIKTEGDTSMRISTSDSGGIKDVYVASRFPTVAGLQYTLYFDLQLNSAIGDRAQYAVLPSGSLAPEDVTNIEHFPGHERPATVEIPPANFDDTWHTYSTTFTATGAEASLAVYIRHGDGPSNLHNYLDNLVLVPEPTALLLLGLGGLMVTRRRR